MDTKDYTGKDIGANRRYKDSMFRDLFGSPERKDNALELYNALNGTSYDDPDLLELTTLDDVIYLNVKNDVSFLIGDELVLWEHQSTHNPNMPLRGLIYFGRLYSAYVERRDLRIYGSAPLKLPSPRFVVFYIGDVKCPDRETLRLSDLFGRPGAVEVECEVVNVNAGRNAQVAAACPTLAGYSEFVARVRRNCATMPVEEAVHAAVADCIAAGVLAEYLSGKRAEVADMFMTEFDEERQRRHDFEEGLEQGLEQGREQKQEQVLRNLMANMGCGLDEAMRLLGIPEDERGKYAE